MLGDKKTLLTARKLREYADRLRELGHPAALKVGTKFCSLTFVVCLNPHTQAMTDFCIALLCSIYPKTNYLIHCTYIAKLENP